MNILKESRIQSGLTQAQLATKSGLSQAYINELEKGKKINPSISVLSRLAQALGVPLSQLLKDEFKTDITPTQPDEVISSLG